MNTSVATVYLPGHDKGQPSLATPGSAGYDMPAILTRPCLNLHGQSGFFTWKRVRVAAEDHDSVFRWLIDNKKEDVELIKRMNNFPAEHLSLVVSPGETVRVPLGIKTAIPEDMVCLLFPRASSSSKEYRLGNCVGVIDSDYREEWFAAVKNCGTNPLLITHGQRIVQCVLISRIQASWPKTDSLTESIRSGGFGSTGDVVESSVTAGDESRVVADSSPSRSDNTGIAYDEPEPATEVERAVRSMIEESTPEEDAALDALLEKEEVSDNSSSVLPANGAEKADVYPVYLVCGNVQVGPVANFRLNVHLPMISSDGVGPVSGILQREIKSLAPKAVDALVNALVAQRK